MINSLLVVLCLHVLEPTFGVDRALLAVLHSAYHEEQLGEGEERVVLKLPARLAPVKIAVFPLLKNKPELVAKARVIYTQLRSLYACEFDDNGNIGKRYRRQDEIGTPFCLTVDFDTLENGFVTVRERDNMQQTKIKVDEMINIFVIDYSRLKNIFYKLEPSALFCFDKFFVKNYCYKIL